MTLVHEQGGIVAIEWPQKCDYWRFECVTDLKRDLGLSDYLVHGCMYDLFPTVGPEGSRIKKPWVIATNSADLGRALARE